VDVRPSGTHGECHLALREHTVGSPRAGDAGGPSGDDAGTSAVRSALLAPSVVRPLFEPAELAPGHARLRSEVVAGRSVFVERVARSPLRLLCPANAGSAAWAYTSSFGGGLVDGDDVRLAVEVGPGAQALVTTQGSTKAYRGSARQEVRASVAAGGLLALLPDPLVAFGGARVSSLVEVELAPDASLVLVDSLEAGRVAAGERWAAARCELRIRVRVDGRAVLDDGLLLDPAHGSVARRMGPFDGWATVVLLGPLARAAAEALLAEERPAHRMDSSFLESAAPLADGCLLRIAACSAAVLAERVALATACVAELVGDHPSTRRF
jgi:urease accessory protein